MARKSKNAGKSTPVEAVVHKKDKRANIPTRELADFVVKEEQAPYTRRYPRDPSLDPQLVWKGKDEQDGEDLDVPTVPIYIQEKISPQAIIENLRLEQKREKPDEQINLFSDFNGIEFEKLIEFYQHKDGVNWANRMILGDSLLVMNSLAEKEGLKGKVQMIYIDPPYGIKFGSNWQVSTRKRDVKDGKVEDANREPEVIKAFRDTWQLGIHSYLAYLRDRVAVARELLTETGSVFLQIGDENVHLVRSVLDEVFGSENFCANIAFAKTTSQTSELLAPVFDYLLWYAKARDQVKFRPLNRAKPIAELVQTTYKKVELYDGTIRNLTGEELSSPGTVSKLGRLMCYGDMVSQSGSESTRQPFDWRGKTFVPRSGGWKTNSAGLQKLAWADKLGASGPTLLYKRYFDDFPYTSMGNLWDDTQLGGFLRGEQKVYVVQTGIEVVKRCVLMSTDPGDLVLDPTCGSGTTAYVAEQWGRRWITIDTSRVALALARTRLMAARYPYYILADSPEGVAKEAELTGHLPAERKTEGDIKKGFVYKRVPHVTLKSIANNPDIKQGMTREQIDAAIAKHADTEILYDQPYEDNKRIRVTGPLAVESLSPHRVLATDDERPASEQDAAKVPGPGQFETMILDNLKKAGVQNTVKKERLTFDRLEPYAGVYLHGAGEYTEGGKSKRVAVCIGPEHGTVGPELVKDAAKEAVKGLGFDLLVVCGFAFDPHVSEEAKQYGKLTVLMARMNPDLSMGDELLKKTGAANLFMVFGEPDVKVTKQKDGKLVVEIKGVDVYDPTTGQIRSHSTDDIACWFIDTDYNEESFFVRHAYFCGADEPYEKLKRALRAEIDEAAWSSLYKTVSRLFDPPTKGKIAIKVINHYGDEVLKVYDV
ncbi:MAG: site-specific DNA-methyltransferase [Deltaproteobacteria bacterium]|nr:site-specific DNA-methyltransferase [Deltaproteobacteria bacterium]